MQSQKDAILQKSTVTIPYEDFDSLCKEAEEAAGIRNDICAAALILCQSMTVRRDPMCVHMQEGDIGFAATLPVNSGNRFIEQIRHIIATRATRHVGAVTVFAGD